jgi:hypothetical protein
VRGGDRFEVSTKAATRCRTCPPPTSATCTGVVDEKKGEVRIHAPADLPRALRRAQARHEAHPDEAESATASRGVPGHHDDAGRADDHARPVRDIAAAGKTIAWAPRPAWCPGK